MLVTIVTVNSVLHTNIYLVSLNASRASPDSSFHHNASWDLQAVNMEPPITFLTLLHSVLWFISSSTDAVKIVLFLLLCFCLVVSWLYHPVEMQSSFLLQSTATDVATLLLASNKALMDFVWCTMLLLLLGNTPHKHHILPFLFLHFHALDSNCIFSERVISRIRSTTVDGIEEYLLSYK